MAPGRGSRPFAAKDPGYGGSGLSSVICITPSNMIDIGKIVDSIKINELKLADSLKFNRAFESVLPYIKESIGVLFTFI